MTKDQERKLDYPFTVDEIEFRIMNRTKDKSKGQIAAYVDARAIQKRLDEVVGRLNWQNNYVSVGIAGETSHIATISIYDEERGEWIEKSNGAGNTDIEPVKGGLSNAFKRAASNWGIGRYLYDFKGVWVKLQDGKYMADGEPEKVKEQYERFRNKYLKKFESATPPADNTPKNTNAKQPSQSSNSSIPPGRFTGSQDAKSPLKDAYQILSLTPTKSGTATYVSLKAPDNKNVAGYIMGEHKLQLGQSICDLKVIQKTDERVGKYNIIESYKIAAQKV